MKKNLILVFGGRSAEHEVSIRSARSLFKAIDSQIFNKIPIAVSKNGLWYQVSESDLFQYDQVLETALPASAEPVCLIPQKTLFYLKSQQRLLLDVAFPIIHGTFGEDGTLQGFFKMIDLPFVGCDVLSSAIGMDKDFMKRILSSSNILNAPSILIRRQDLKNKIELFTSIAKQLNLPFFIKPANAGSSVGVHKIKNQDDFINKIEDSFLFDHKVLAEQYIQGREIECSVMGLNENIKASLPGEVIPQHDFYSYEAKYLDDQGALLKIPASLSQEQIEKIQKTAIAAYKALSCEGLTRVDFFLTAEDQVYVNEVNTLPGFTQISMYPKMWEVSGVSFSSLTSQLIDLAFIKYQQDQKLKTLFFST